MALKADQARDGRRVLHQAGAGEIELVHIESWRSAELAATSTGVERPGLAIQLDGAAARHLGGEGERERAAAGEIADFKFDVFQHEGPGVRRRSCRTEKRPPVIFTSFTERSMTVFAAGSVRGLGRFRQRVLGAELGEVPFAVGRLDQGDGRLRRWSSR